MRKPLKFHKTRSYIRERLIDPKVFDPSTFRIKRVNGPQTCIRCNAKRGHLLVVAKRPGSDTTEVQAILHPKSEEGKLRTRAARAGTPWTAANPAAEYEDVLCTKCGAPLVYHARVNTAGVKGVLCYKCSKCDKTFIRNGGLRQFQVA